MAQTALITGVGRRRGITAGIAAGLAADGWEPAQLTAS
jgi:3-oxoacyl-[acyl-carrier protein] reductase